MPVLSLSEVDIPAAVSYTHLDVYKRQAHEHARRIDNLKIALLREIRVIADLMDGTALRVGSDERHGLAATLKRKGKLVRDGGLADPALLVEHQNRVHAVSYTHLDVYKRQRLESCAKLRRKVILYW